MKRGFTPRQQPLLVLTPVGRDARGEEER